MAAADYPKGRTLLVDGDILVYRCGFAGEKTRYLLENENGYTEYSAAKEIPKDAPPGTLWSRKEVEPVENVLHTVKLIYERWQNDFDPKAIRTYLSGKRNYRDELAVTKEYKGNRVAAKPVHYQAIRDYLVKQYGASITDGIEADDALASDQTADTIIVSIDKDLLQVPGLHYNWVKDELIEISKKDGLLNFYHQLLTGDPTDNVPGLAGVGPVAASRILEGSRSPHEAFQRVYNQYRTQVPDYETCLKYLNEQALLLWIRRERNTNWRPPMPYEEAEKKYGELPKPI